MSIANRFAPQESRGQVVSTYFVFAYAGLIIPVVGVGFASDYVGDFPAVLGCSIALAALCVLSATIIVLNGCAGLMRCPRVARSA